MNSRQQLLDSLTAHISLYHSQTPYRFPNSNPNPRSSVLRWFSSLSVNQRRAHMTAIDPSFIAILLQMKGKLRSNGAGRFIILSDLPQNNDSSMPTLCYRKSEGLVSRFAEFSCAQRVIHESVELFSSTEGERDVKGDANGFPCLDAMCVAEGLVSDVNQFVEVMDEITNGEFLRGGDEGEMAGDWVELGWLKAKGYYSLEEFVVNRIEVSLRLSWLGSNSGKKRGVKLKDKVSAAGVAANVFWRKKGCVDWWEKLDGCVKKKVYSAFLGKAAGKLTDDIVKGNLPFLDDKMWCLNDQEKLMQRRDSSFVGTRNIATCRRTYPKTKSNDKHVTVPQKLSPLYYIFNSLYILQIICNLLSAAQCGEYNKLFFSPLDSVSSISDVMLRKFRDFLMVISLDCTKIELLGEGTKALTKKLNNKPVTPSRKKKGKNQNKKSNPIPRSCQDDPKRANPTEGEGDEVLCTSNGVDRHPSKFDCEVPHPRKFDCEVPKKDLVREVLSSADAMESVKGVNNGKFRGAPRKSRKERKKYKSSGPNGSEVSSCESRCTRVSPASVSSQPGPPVPDLAMGCSTFKNVTSNGGIQINRLDANPMLCSKLTDDNPGNVYSTETDSHLCVKHHPDISDAVLSGSETTRHNSSKCDLDSCAKTCDPAVEYNDKMCTRVVSGRNPTTGYLGKLSRGGEEVKPPLVQENGSLGVLRVGTMSSPAYVSYEWPNVAPFHPSTNAHRPATTDRLHLDVGHTLQNNFHHSFVHTVQVRKSPIDNNGYNGILSRPLPMSLDWPPVVRGVNRIVPSVTSNYDTEFISRRQSRFQQGVTGQNFHCGVDSEDERTISSDLIDFPDVPIPQELVEEHDKNWMSEEELETHAVSGMDYNQYFGGGVMYWNPSDHPGTSFSRPPSLCSDDSSWAWREADMNRAVDDMVAFSSSYSTNGLTSPSTASFCSPFDPLGPGAIGYVMPGGEISNKVLHSSSTMNDGGAEESVSGSMSNISGDGEMKTVDSHPYPILRPIVIPSMSRDRSRSEFKRNYDHKSPCVPPNRREHPRIKRPPSPVVLCVPHAPHPPPPSHVGDSRKQRGFPTVRSGSSSPRHWGVKGWFHDGVSFEEACVPMEGSDIVWPSWRNKALSARQLPQPLAGPFLQDRLMAISQLTRDQEHPDVILPLQPPDTQNCSTRKASLSLIHDVLHDEIDLFCKQVAAENLIRKPYINWAVKRVARSLQVLWPRARTNIYGSNATGLSLPSSDVDLVVCLPPVRNLEPIKEAGILEGRNGIKETCLQHAARYLANQEWVKSDSLKIVENTAIPIIMLVAEVPHDPILTQSNVQTSNQEAEQLCSTGGDHFQPDTTSSEGNASPEWSKTMSNINDGFKSVRIDISFKSPTHTGLQTTGLVKDLTERFPAVMPLTLVLKQFLADRSLDQSYSGGLSSYCLILLITRFLQHEHHHGRPTNQSYGSLLMDFLYFFGNVFEPRQMRVSVQGSGVYLKRERGCSIDPLYIDDPLFLTNNVGRNCFRIHQCIKAFADAYAMLENELTCVHNDDDSNAKPHCELLPKLIPSIAHFVGS